MCVCVCVCVCVCDNLPGKGDSTFPGILKQKLFNFIKLLATCYETGLSIVVLRIVSTCVSLVTSGFYYLFHVILLCYDSSTVNRPTFYFYSVNVGLIQHNSVFLSI